MEPRSFGGLFSRGAKETAPPVPGAAGSRVSATVPVRRAGRIYHGVFACREDGGLHAWALFDPASGALARYSLWELEPPSQVQDIPDAPLTPESAGRERLTALLTGLDPFLFESQLDPEQAALRDGYREEFARLVPERQRSVYRALSPEFFAWLEGEPEPEVPPPEPDPEPEPEPEPEEVPIQSPPLDPHAVYGELQELRELFQRKIDRDAHKQKLFDEMHAELQSYKNGMVDAITRPMEEDIIKLIDDIQKMMEHHRGRPFSPDNHRRLFSLFEGVRTDLTDLLYRHGVEPFTQEGEEVVVGRQKILATVPTAKKEQDKLVAQRLSQGWEKNGRVIRPERISVYLYETQSEK